MADIIRRKLSTALSHLNPDVNIDISFSKAKIIACVFCYNIYIINESLEIIIKRQKICNDLLSYQVLHYILVYLILLVHLVWFHSLLLNQCTSLEATVFSLLNSCYYLAKSALRNFDMI